MASESSAGRSHTASAFSHDLHPTAADCRTIKDGPPSTLSCRSALKRDRLPETFSVTIDVDGALGESYNPSPRGVSQPPRPKGAAGLFRGMGQPMISGIASVSKLIEAASGADIFADRS